MPRLLLALAVALLTAAPAGAHEGNPNYLSRVDSAPAGVKVEVVNRDDRLLLRDTGDEEVIVEGYNGEPYARIEPDGTVSVNKQSPAYYLNDERFGDVPVPEGVDGKAEPEWEQVSKTGRFEWHDHRMHWMSQSRPPQVTDPDKRTTIFDWKVPVTVAGRDEAIAGTLFWTPRPGAPVGLIVGLSVFTLLACGAALVVRRRRGRSPEPEAW